MVARQPLIRPERYGFFDKLLFAVFVLFLPPLLASKPGLFGDGDVSWHVAAGRWILQNRAIPTTDPFSFTMAGHPWIAHEWLSEVIYASAFDLGGICGAGGNRRAGGNGASLDRLRPLERAGRAGRDAGIVPRARPDPCQVHAGAAARARLAATRAVDLTAPGLQGQGAGAAALAALLVTVWTNLHGSFPIAWIVAAPIALDAVISARWSRPVLLGWLTFGIASVLAMLLNANGLTQLLLPLNILGMKSVYLIQEWNPSSPSISPLFYVVLLGTLAVMMLRGAKLRLGETILLLFLLGWAFSQIRHQSWLVIVATMVLAPHLSGQRAAEPLFPDSARSPALGWGSIGGRRAPCAPSAEGAFRTEA